MLESVDGTVIVATWDFGKACNDAALEALQQGGTALDAVEQGAWVAEADPGNNSVGRGGIPNQQGEVEVDAAIMWGPGSQAGSVAASRIWHGCHVSFRFYSKLGRVFARPNVDASRRYYASGSSK